MKPCSIYPGRIWNAIQNGLRQAEKAGMVKFKRILFESQNNAVHVEVESVSPKAFNVLGRRKNGGPGNAGTPGGTATPESEDDQRRRMLQQLQDLHDREPDPAKKIDYDRSKRNLLDPAAGADAAAITALDDEIERHFKRKRSSLRTAAQENKRSLRLAEL
ncbi:MAG: hypothetical protein WKF84_10155 [Pyrinomonadaceae bacterium]